MEVMEKHDCPGCQFCCGGCAADQHGEDPREHTCSYGFDPDAEAKFHRENPPDEGGEA